MGQSKPGNGWFANFDWNWFENSKIYSNKMEKSFWNQNKYKIQYLLLASVNTLGGLNFFG